MSTECPIPKSWTEETLWACEAKICWDEVMEIKPGGNPIADEVSGFILKMTITPVNRGNYSS